MQIVGQAALQAVPSGFESRRPFHFILAYVEQRNVSVAIPVPGISRCTLHTPDGEPDAIGSPNHCGRSQAAKGGGLQIRSSSVQIRSPAPTNAELGFRNAESEITDPKS